MLPASLALIEISCFQKFNRSIGGKAYFWTSIVGGLIISIGSWLFVRGIVFSILNGYNNRTFSLAERLLTEPRILLFYLSQIFLPLPGRLSVEHDVILSTSILQPWTTMPAILLIFSLLGFGLTQINKRPLIAMAILFFFLNHIIESTIIPLELIFEHRNYLPSMFLFLPVAVGFQWLYDRCSASKLSLKGVLTGFLVSLLVCLGVGTYIRNLTWSTEISLWRDAMKKAPQSARPLTNLAWQMAYGADAHESQYNKALRLYEKALSLQTSRSSSEHIILNNMAGIHFKQGRYLEAIELLDKALTISPGYNRGRYDLATILIVSGKWDMAEKHTDYLLGIDNAHEKYLCLKGLVLMHEEKYDLAIDYFRRSLSSYPFLKVSLMNLGIAYSLKGDYSNAEVYLIRAFQVPPKNSMIPLMGLIENSTRAADYKGAQKFAGILSDRFSRSAIDSQLDGLSKDLLSVFLSAESITTFIKQQYAENSRISSYSECQNQPSDYI
jgi:tetratricopeptide (TPR) repeat protein